MKRVGLFGVSVGALALGAAGCLGNNNPGGEDRPDAWVPPDNGNGDGNGNGNGANGNGNGNGSNGNGNGDNGNGNGDNGNGEAEIAQLYITEVMARGEEFIEIWNPNDEPVDLENYYIADTGSYATLPSIDPSDYSEMTLTGVSGHQFIARFPDDATLAAGEVAVVALHGGAFEAEYGEPQAPTFALRQPGDFEAMVPIRVHRFDSQESLLRQDGEALYLFYWDGESPLVTDVDSMVHGTIAEDRGVDSRGNLLNKGELEPIEHWQSGETASYEDDEFELGTADGQFGEVSPDDCSYRRTSIAYDVEDGGNGIGGRDVTSMDMKDSWTNQDGLSSGDCLVEPGTLPADLE